MDYTHSHPSTIDSLSSTTQLSPVHYTTIYFPQNIHHTYLLLHFHSHSVIYCHANSTVPFYYDTLHHCHIALHDRKIASMMFSWLGLLFDVIATLDHCTSQ